MSARFRRYELRTTDVSAARAFYEAVLGHGGDAIVELPATARERGAPAHWLGHIGPVDVDGIVSQWMAGGAMRLGPPSAERAIVRDPNGATVALTSESPVSRADVVWHLLNTAHVARALACYLELFGWQERDCTELPAPFGLQRRFAFGQDAPAAGALTDISARPTVHEHWLYFFGVPSFDEALARVLANGGEVFAAVEGPDGVRGAMCHDPQGAAFGLMKENDGSSTHARP